MIQHYVTMTKLVLQGHKVGPSPSFFGGILHHDIEKALSIMQLTSDSSACAFVFNPHQRQCVPYFSVEYSCMHGLGRLLEGSSRLYLLLY